MCLMCEEEAFHRAYLEYMARKEAAAGQSPAPLANPFQAEVASAEPARPPVSKP